MIPQLGIIEGFFGRPWSWAARRETVLALAPHGYGFYLYAPKADPYLRRRWQVPHPEAELEAIADFARFCRAQGIRFGIGLTPFELHLADGREWQEPLAAKLAALAPLPIDDLAILFDDMRGDVPALAERQTAIVHFAAERSSASRILACPSYYSDDPILDIAFGPRPDRYLADLGHMLDPAIGLMWTGEEVCSREISPGHLARVAEQMRRKPFLWDNYPVNDGPRMSEHLHLRAFTGRPATNATLIAAHGVNPASQPVLSRIPLLTLPQSYAGGDAYLYAEALGEAARTVLGEDLGRRVVADLLTLQDRGRDRLGPRRETLRARYAAFDHPGAREIVEWLDGHWAVTDADVQTQ